MHTSNCLYDILLDPKKCTFYFVLVRAVGRFENLRGQVVGKGPFKAKFLVIFRTKYEDIGQLTHYSLVPTALLPRNSATH